MKSFFAGLIAVFFSGYTVLGQIQTDASCQSTFAWGNNSLAQSPCMVAAYLQGACSSGVWTTPALPHTASGEKQAYFGPNTSTRNLCTCSWAVYNLISACAACQDGAWLLWANWSVNCSAANLLSNQPFPQQISVPSDTAIPEYAGKDPVTWTGGSFNVAEARAIGSHNIQITTTSSPSSTGPATSGSTVPTNDPGSGSGPALGPIIGGVVGGILGVSLIAVLAVFLLCPSRFRRGRKAADDHQPEKQALGTLSQQPTGSGVVAYHTPPPPNSSHQELLAIPPTRPPIAPRFTSSTYSFSSADHSMNSSMVPQPIQQQTMTAPWHQPVPEMMINSTPSPANASVHSTVQDTSTVTSGTNASVRSFFTRATPRNGHAHTPSDTSVTSSSSLLPRMQQGLWRQQSLNRNEVVAPYILTPSSTEGASSSAGVVDRKQRPPGLQYTPPPEVRTLSEASGSDGPVIEYHPPMNPPAFSPGLTAAHEYGMMMAPSTITTGEVEADRQTNMSPANASSILEAAPPYASAEPHDSIGRGAMPLRRTPRLPDVEEYPEEKARFTNAAREQEM